MTTDLLLLNATNLPWRPIFPYAFVQVSALARRAGLRVKTLDLLGVPRDRWESFLGSYVAQHQPRAIGLHIRQGDSVFLDDYYAPAQGPQTTRNYFPIDDNKALVQTLRRVTTAPIMAGGFGFTTHAHRLFDHLELDLAVQGCPDDVIANFDRVLAGRDLAGIKSLVHRENNTTTFNERGFYTPFAGREWTDEIVDEASRFYGHATLFGDNPPTIPIEIMRGCPFKCFFCTEPVVKGRDIRVRDLDVIEGELEFLVSRNLRRFWFVCSELDAQGTKFAMQLAERVVKLRERTGNFPIEWSAYSLPRLEEDELRLLQRAGYVGALNDVLSLDDNNLRKCGVPYRSKQAVAFLKAVTKLDREERATAASNAATAESKVKAGLTQRTPKELASILGLFLGNAHATAETLRTTLRRIEDEGIRENYTAGLPFPATRVFAPNGTPICPTTERGLHTYGPDKTERPIDFINPTYYYPDFLIEKLGSPDAVIELMRYIGETFMSVAHRARKDWAAFLTTHTTPERLAALIRTAGPLPADALDLAQAIASEPGRARELFAPPQLTKPAWNAATAQLLAHVFAAFSSKLARVRGVLGIDPAWSEYRVVEHLSRLYSSREMLLADAAQNEIEAFYVEWILYANNVQLRPDYAELLFEAQPIECRASA